MFCKPLALGAARLPSTKERAADERRARGVVFWQFHHAWSSTCLTRAPVLLHCGRSMIFLRATPFTPLDAPIAGCRCRTVVRMLHCPSSSILLRRLVAAAHSLRDSEPMPSLGASYRLHAASSGPRCDCRLEYGHGGRAKVLVRSAMRLLNLCGDLTLRPVSVLLHCLL